MLYPIVTESRAVIDLSGIWNFKLDDGKGFEHKWYEAKLDNPIRMAVPSSYNDLAVGKEIRDHVGWVWYEREFAVPAMISSERVVLRFGSATHTAKVYVNGILAAEHKGGFTPFECEINSLLAAGKNRLTVAVNNVLDESTLPIGIYSEKEVPGLGKVVKNSPNFDFFNYAGLHRPVKIYTTPRTYVRDITVVTRYEGDTGFADYELAIEGDAEARVSVLDENGAKAADFSRGAQGTVEIAGVKLWEPQESYLYTLKVELMKEDRILDVYEQPFGVRTVEVKDRQFLINGKPFYFKGFGKHEDAPVHGRGMDEAVNVKDFQLMKWLGANSFRTSHYPYSEELMRLADKEGIVVIDETPAVGLHLSFMTMFTGGERRSTWSNVTTLEHHKDVIRELIARDKNHPCVVMWSLANEAATEEEGAYDYFAPLADLAKELDPQKRPITIVTHQMATPEKCQVSDLVDVLALNRYYGWYFEPGSLDTAKAYLRQELQGWQSRCPGKPVIFTEYGADTIAGFHDVDSVMFTEEYQAEYLQANHQVFDEFEHVIGEQVWNFADFQTSQGIMRVQGNKKGIFTRERKPKYAAYELRSRWSSIPNYYYK
ncbi:beta-glucuronidase [Paenibacillus doosanensis]|uniref:beta-glucuronidase n=1 Tax=Paenibacillus doosanensis TaxID=1229154 RepID=UPI00217F254A|nr:beta-glucuronidase [Paenibacillus doosanensis]MCS7462318.1 beta-glucuronidase [Paenibacillus doosanensis]